MMNKIYIPPLSEKYSEGEATKNEWLMRYFIYRDSVNGLNREELAQYQESLGKNSSVLADRFRGCLLGLAIGDALGTTLEFKERENNENHKEMIGGGVFNLKGGQWTDDTSMALCMAYSLLDKKSFDPEDQMNLYVKWYREGLFSSNGICFDIGNTTAAALSRFEQSREPYSGSEDERSAGNGSIMRLAPVPLFFLSSAQDAIVNAGLSSKTTHANIEAIDGCRYFSALLIGALMGEPKEKLLNGLYDPVGNFWEYFPLTNKIRSLSNGEYKRKKRSEIRSTGYVVDTLEAALWSFYNSEDFETGMIKAVNLAGDADTIGAVYGQIAGAFYGETSIPYRWIKHLTTPHVFYYLADEFVSYYSGAPTTI
jgi:ADP-ribosyl-[dinitrogen reductase] hydrolase